MARNAWRCSRARACASDPDAGAVKLTAGASETATCPTGGSRRSSGAPASTWELTRARTSRTRPERGARTEVCNFMLSSTAMVAPASTSSPAPAVVVAIHVTAGEDVEAGATIAVLESMKLQTAVRAPRSGRVREVLARVNSQVDAGAPLVRLDRHVAELAVSDAPAVSFTPTSDIS